MSLGSVLSIVAIELIVFSVSLTLKSIVSEALIVDSAVEATTLLITLYIFLPPTIVIESMSPVSVIMATPKVVNEGEETATANL